MAILLGLWFSCYLKVLIYVAFQSFDYDRTWWRLFQSFDYDRTWWRLFQSFDYDRTWWRLFQKCVVHYKLDVYVFIIIFFIPLLIYQELFHLFQLNLNSNMTSFFRFANKQAIHLDGKISLAHAWCTHLSQVIKSQNKIIYTVVNVLNIYIHWK